MNALRRLHRDDNAQVSFLAVAGALCFTALLAMVVNTSDVIKHRVHMQEVADVTALSAANWNARGMNLVSMINVLNSKMLTMTVLVNSLNKTLPIVEKIAVVQKIAFQACSGVPFVGVFCAVMAAIVTVQENVIKAMYKVIEQIAKHTECKASATVFKVMSGLQKAAVGIQSSFPAIAIAESVNIASINGASFGVSLSGGILTKPSSPADALKLPLELGPKGTEDFCTAILAGGPGYVMEGYDNGQGPMRLGKKIWDTVFIAFVNLLPHPIFYGFYASYMKQIGCPPDDPSGDGDDEIQFYDLKDCRKYNASATWTFVSSDTGWIEDGSLTSGDFAPWQSQKAGQGDRPDNESDFAGLDGLDPTGAGIGNASIPTPTFGPGYAALVANNNESSRRFPGVCSKGDSDSGYPTIFNFGDINLSDFTHYNAKHTRSPVDEKTGMYYLKMEKSDRKETRGTGETDQDGKEITEEVTLFLYDVQVWVLSDSGKKKMDEDELDEYIKDKTDGTGSKPPTLSPQGCRGLVKPLLIDKLNNPQNRLRFISFVYKDLGGDAPTPLPFWSTFFNQPPTRITAYAQAQVYNELSEDMFTQDWRVRLEQASLLEKAITQSTKPDGKAIGFGAGVATDFVGSVNNH